MAGSPFPLLHGCAQNESMSARADQREWRRYRRSDHLPVEALHARFQAHVYHRHSHDAYCFGVTESGAQTFRCRGWSRTSAAGMVMALNPDEPHDGRSADALGFGYRMLYVAPGLVAELMGEATGRAAGPPLFPEPVLTDTRLARSLRRLHATLLEAPGRLAEDEAVAGVVLAMARHSAGGTVEPRPVPPMAAQLAARVRELLHERDDLGLDELAARCGASRFAVHRAFRDVHGMSPADYHRQVRLDEARRLLRAGTSIAEAAARTGFSDQSHLNRWFGRCFGITPGDYRRGWG